MFRLMVVFFRLLDFQSPEWPVLSRLVFRRFEMQFHLRKIKNGKLVQALSWVKNGGMNQVL